MVADKRDYLGVGWKFPLQVTPGGKIAQAKFEQRSVNGARMLPAVDDDGIDLLRRQLANDRRHLDAFGTRSYDQQDATVPVRDAQSHRVQRRIHTLNGMRQTVSLSWEELGRPARTSRQTAGFLCSSVRLPLRRVSHGCRRIANVINR